MDSRLTECGICRRKFSDYCCPRVLPCSHSLCTPCIGEIISREEAICCPSCKQEFMYQSSEDIVINGALLVMSKSLCSSLSKETLKEMIDNFREKIIKKGIEGCQKEIPETWKVIEKLLSIKDNFSKDKQAMEEFIERLEILKLSNQLDLKAPRQKTLGDNIEEKTRKVCDDIQNEEIAETYEKIEIEIENSKEDEYTKNESIDKIIKNSNDLMNLCGRAMKIFNKKSLLLVNRIELLLRDQKNLKKDESKLEGVADHTSAGPIMDKVQVVCNALQEKVKENQEHLQETEKAMSDTEKDILKSKEGLKNVIESTKGVFRAGEIGKILPQDSLISITL